MARRRFSGPTNPVMYCSIPSNAALPQHRRGQRDPASSTPSSTRRCGPGDGGEAFAPRYEESRAAAAARPAPRFVIISAGFDACICAIHSPISIWSKPTSPWATQKLMDVADRFADDRVVSLLEGSYDLEALANSTAALRHRTDARIVACSLD